MFKIPTIPTIVGQMDTVHNDKYKWCAGVMFVCGEETFSFIDMSERVRGRRLFHFWHRRSSTKFSFFLPPRL